MAKYVMFVMTNCAPGTDAEFNDWYDRIHLPDVLKVPGIVAAQRYKLTDEQRRQTRPDYGYMAAYEIESRNLPKTFSLMNEGLKSVYKSPSMNPSTWAYFFQPVGKRQVKAGTKPAAKKGKPAKAAAKKGKPAKAAAKKSVKRPVAKRGVVRKTARKTARKGK